MKLLQKITDQSTEFVGQNDPKIETNYLDGNSREDGMFVGDDEVIGQNDDLALDFLRHALCSGLGYVEPHGFADRN